MGAVNQTVSSSLYTQLQQARTKASQESEDSRWSLEYNIDKAVANVIQAAGIKRQIEQAVQAVLTTFNATHP
jgi:hypothetical protein